MEERGYSSGTVNHKTQCTIVAYTTNASGTAYIATGNVFATMVMSQRLQNWPLLAHVAEINYNFRNKMHNNYLIESMDYIKIINTHNNYQSQCSYYYRLHRIMYIETLE